MSGKYRTIVADPPWEYEPYPSMPGAAGTKRKSIRKPMPYPQMPVAAIKALGVPDLAATDCALWLWTTSRYLRDAFDVAEAWGFRFRQVIVWRKTGATSPFPAAVAPNHAEFLYYCVKGEPGRARTLPSNIVEAPKQYAHSRKPEVFLDLIESVSPSPRLELFARRQRMGWDTWGNEALNHVNVGESA